MPVVPFLNVADISALSCVTKRSDALKITFFTVRSDQKDGALLSGELSVVLRFAHVSTAAFGKQELGAESESSILACVRQIASDSRVHGRQEAADGGVHCHAVRHLSELKVSPSLFGVCVAEQFTMHRYHVEYICAILKRAGALWNEFADDAISHLIKNLPTGAVDSLVATSSISSWFNVTYCNCRIVQFRDIVNSELQSYNCAA